jgi:hypothetical protein
VVAFIMDSNVISADLAMSIELSVKSNNLTSVKNLNDSESALLLQYHQIQASKKYGDLYDQQQQNEWEQTMDELAEHQFNIKMQKRLDSIRQ